MPAIIYVTLDDTLALHRFIMERMGAAPALRDAGLLESALMRPQTAAYYEGADLPMQAVLLKSGIALAHPFVDGNKRTALLVGDVFLQRNGLAFSGNRLDFAKRVEGIIDRTDTLAAATERFAAWLRANLRPS